MTQHYAQSLVSLLSIAHSFFYEWCCISLSAGAISYCPFTVGKIHRIKLLPHKSATAKDFLIHRTHNVIRFCVFAHRSPVKCLYVRIEKYAKNTHLNDNF